MKAVSRITPMTALAMSSANSKRNWATLYETHYSWDNANRLLTQTNPSGRTIHYQRDAIGRINRVFMPVITKTT